MECKSANILMMKYMDSLLTEKEALSLNVHIVECSQCKDDFMLYKSMIEEFETRCDCFFKPPDGFEARVMEIVSKIEPDYTRTYTQDMVVGFVFGAFSMFFGAGVITSIFREEITSVFSNYPAALSVIEAAGKLSSEAYAFIGEVTQRVSYYLYSFSGLIEAAQYGILAIIAALVAAQCIIYSKNKAEA